MPISVIIRRVISDEKKSDPAVPGPPDRQNSGPWPPFSPATSAARPSAAWTIRVNTSSLSTWDSLEHWNRWFHSDHRKTLQKQIDDLLGEKNPVSCLRTAAGRRHSEFLDFDRSSEKASRLCPRKHFSPSCRYFRLNASVTCQRSGRAGIL